MKRDLVLTREMILKQVHCDQSEKGALRRLKMNVCENEDIDELLRRRVEIIKCVRTQPL